ncbi:hypothetical protein [Bradyrhizobium sp. 23AC]
MSNSYPLPPEPVGIVTSLVERFHSGDASVTMLLYDPEAALVPDDTPRSQPDSNAISGSVCH